MPCQTVAVPNSGRFVGRSVGSDLGRRLALRLEDSGVKPPRRGKKDSCAKTIGCTPKGHDQHTTPTAANTAMELERLWGDSLNGVTA